MKNKHSKNPTKTNSVKPLGQFHKYCRHCGGTFKYYQDEASCLMCGRDSKHFCDNCLTDSHSIRKSA